MLAALPFVLVCVQNPSVLFKRLSRPRMCIYIISAFFFCFLVRRVSLVDRATGGERGGMEQSHPAEV